VKRVLISALILSLITLLTATGKAQDKTEYLLFVRDDGLGIVGYLDRVGAFIQTAMTTTFSHNWEKIVSAENGVLFYRSDGTAAVVQIDREGQIRTTHSGLGFAANWTHIVSTGRYLLFVRNDGLGAVGYISREGRFVQTQSLPLGSLTFAWSNIVSTDEGLFFYRTDGLFSVGRIDANGQLTIISLHTSAQPNWSHIVSTGKDLFFYRTEGIGEVGHTHGFGAVGHIDRSGVFVQTQSITGMTHFWTNIVDTGRYLLFYRQDDRLGGRGRINENGRFTMLESYEEISIGARKIVKNGSNLIFLGRYGHLQISHFDYGGTFHNYPSHELPSHLSHVVNVVQ
jgi:hypothetical protein